MDDHRSMNSAIADEITPVEPTKSRCASSTTISRGGSSSRLKIALVSSPSSSFCSSSVSPLAASSAATASRKSSAEPVRFSGQLNRTIGIDGYCACSRSLARSAISVFPIPGKPWMMATGGPFRHQVVVSHSSSAWCCAPNSSNISPLGCNAQRNLFSFAATVQCDPRQSAGRSGRALTLTFNAFHGLRFST